MWENVITSSVSEIMLLCYLLGKCSFGKVYIWVDILTRLLPSEFDEFNSISQNNSVVETHVGADVRLHCRITRDSDYGTVSVFFLI